VHRDLPPALRPPTVPLIPRIALRPDEAAQAIGICTKSLRDLPDGPPVVRLGRSVLYRVASLDQWLAERERTPDEIGPADDVSPST
jgi:hypothetical protein